MLVVVFDVDDEEYLHQVSTEYSLYFDQDDSKSNVLKSRKTMSTKPEIFQFLGFQAPA
jgi:hypothetical protein